MTFDKIAELIKMAVPTDQEALDLTPKVCHTATQILAYNSDYIMRYFYNKRDGSERIESHDWENGLPALVPFNLPTREEIVTEDGEQVKYYVFEVEGTNDSEAIIGLLRQGFYAEGTISDYSLGNLFTVIKNLMDDRDNQSNFLRIYYGYKDVSVRALGQLNLQNGFEIVNLLLNLTKSQIFSDNPIASTLIRYRLRDYERVLASALNDHDPEGALNVLIDLAKNHNQIWDSQYFIERVLVKEIDKILGALNNPEASIAKKTLLIKLLHHLVEAVAPDNQQSDSEERFNIDNSPLMSRLRGGLGFTDFEEPSGSLNLNIPEVATNSEEQLNRVLDAIASTLQTLNHLLLQPTVSD